MKSITAVLLTASAALILAACGAPPANNAPATNANNARANAPAAPTVDTLFDMDKKANEAYSKGDSAYFDGFLSDKFAMMSPKGEHMNKAETVKMIGAVKCDVKSMDLTEPQMAKIDADTYVISYKAAWDGTCADQGKSMKIPSPVRSASIYVRNGDKWAPVWHGETKIMGENNAPANANTTKPETKKDEPKAEAKKPETMKKADSTATDTAATKAAPAKASAPSALSAATAANANTATAAKPAADPNTDALLKLHTAGWEAYKARDAKKLEDMTAATLSFVDPQGMWFGTKDAVIKAWTEGKCDIKTTSVADGFAQALSPTLELFFAKGTAAGTCDGPDGKPVKLGSLWNDAVYVKEGTDWKLAFLFESPAA